MEELVDQALIKRVETESMDKWSDERRKEFCQTFEDRAMAASYILAITAHKIWETAIERHFVSDKHSVDLVVKSRNGLIYLPNQFFDKTSNYSCRTAGSRSVDELKKLAEERAELILAELPPLKDAVRIIDPVTAKRLDKRDALLKQVKLLKVKFEQASEAIKMVDLDQSMTIGEFRKMCKDREKLRKRLADEMNEIGKEGTELAQQINKALYAGLPGLSDAVVKVVNEHIERATGLGAMTRRVTERVMFGDSKAALEILKGFEKDEVEVSANIKAEFAEALGKLKIAGHKLLKGRK